MKDEENKGTAEADSKFLIDTLLSSSLNKDNQIDLIGHLPDCSEWKANGMGEVKKGCRWHNQVNKAS